MNEDPTPMSTKDVDNVATETKTTPQISSSPNSPSAECEGEIRSKEDESESLSHEEEEEQPLPLISAECEGENEKRCASKKAKRSKEDENESPSHEEEEEQPLISYKDNLVGSRIKVWWKIDKKYYNGVIASFNTLTKEHRLMATPELQKQITNLNNVVSLLVGRVQKNESEVEELKTKMKDLEKTVENTAVSSGTWSSILTEIKEQMNGLKLEIAQVSSSCASSCASASAASQGSEKTLAKSFKRLWERNLFENSSYILIPIFERKHWSLVIICFPAEGEDASPTLLHLDSMAMHVTTDISEKIKWLLKQNWKNVKGQSSNFPNFDTKAVELGKNWFKAVEVSTSLHAKMGQTEEEVAVGIDLGTTFSCVGIYQNDRVEIIANDLSNRTTPSYVAFTDDGRLLGEAARKQAALNPVNTIFEEGLVEAIDDGRVGPRDDPKIRSKILSEEIG
ncbi:hypothetical protein AgCh_014137 [Apium graveolens]